MTGVDWARMDQPVFDRIVDTILGRIYGDRGYAPEGRGGDQGIDYSVDDNKIIYQYKFFPDGAHTSARRRQIARSFHSAMQHEPDEWHLVIPAKTLPKLREHVLGLGSNVKIFFHDREWLDNRLIDYPDLAQYFQHRTSLEYLHAEADKMKINPLFRTGADVTSKVADLQGAINATDPDWTFDISTLNGEITRTLRAKDPNAAARSPITISYTAVVPAAVGERLSLDFDYGLVEPIHLTGSMVEDFKITGPELIAYDGPVDALELLPDPNSSSPWADIDLIVTDSAAQTTGTFLGRSRTRSRGTKGLTIEVQLNPLITMLFRAPDDEGENGRVDITTEDFSGHAVGDVLVVTDFLSQLRLGSTLDFQLAGSRLMRIILNGSLAGGTDHYANVRGIAGDLVVIERETPARFRFPANLTVLDRIAIRNVRLLLEGHVVAHPTDSSFGGILNGDWDPSLDALLDPGPGWMKWVSEPGEMLLLGKLITVPSVAMGGPTRLAGNDVVKIRKAIKRGKTAGLRITFKLEPDDRLRVWLPDRFKGEQLWITPWDLPSIEQPAGTLAAIQPQPPTADRTDSPADEEIAPAMEDQDEPK